MNGVENVAVVEARNVIARNSMVVPMPIAQPSTAAMTA